MTPARLLATLTARDVGLWVDGDGLRFRGHLSEADIESVRSSKAALIDILEDALPPHDWRIAYRDKGYIESWMGTVPAGARWLCVDGANWHPLT